jgi:FecR protein
VFTLNHLGTRLFVLASAGFIGMTVHAAAPYTSATVTRLQNKVQYGDAALKSRRSAQSGDVVKADTYLLTETDSRAELKYVDGTIVRIGQNTVFTFEADTRTLTLEKGSLLFYIPKGQGGGTIRTASITAAITGTIGKVTDNIIAILEGEVTLVPSGKKVPAGFFARANPDGTLTIARFDPATALEGKLMNFGGKKIAEFDETRLSAPAAPPTTMPDLSGYDTLDRTQNHPGAQELYFPKAMMRAPVPPPSPPAKSAAPTPIPGGRPKPKP